MVQMLYLQGDTHITENRRTDTEWAGEDVR